MLFVNGLVHVSSLITCSQNNLTDMYVFTKDLILQSINHSFIYR